MVVQQITILVQRVHNQNDWEHLQNIFREAWLQTRTPKIYNKQYNDSIQQELNEGSLAFQIGKYNISNIAMADDLLGVSCNSGNLQIILNKIANYGKKYRVAFSATVVGQR